MSNANQSVRSSESQSAVLARLGVDKTELKSIKVAIMRRNVSEPNTTSPLLRNLEEPAQLVIHYRPDEGVRPIFDRDDIIVNKESQEERMILSSSQQITEKTEKPLQHAPSRSSSVSSRSSVTRSRTPAKQEKKRTSPQPHTSRDYPKLEYRHKDYHSSKYRRSTSASRKAVYKTSPQRPSHSSSHRSPYRSPERSRRKERTSPRVSSKDRSPYRYRRRSRSPGGYKGPRRSRTPPKLDRGRTPPKYRGPPERRRSRSPPPRDRGRSRSYSPRRSSRYSRSPHRDYRYERSKRSRSRSPRRHRYSDERDRIEERIYPPRIPNPYFEGAEFWIPDPMMQPRFIPRGMIPHGAFPYAPFRPGMPPMMAPRVPFRPRIVYNNRTPRPKAVISNIPAIESATVTTTSAGGSSKDGEEEKEEVGETQENDRSEKADESRDKSN